MCLAAQDSVQHPDQWRTAGYQASNSQSVRLAWTSRPEDVERQDHIWPIGNHHVTVRESPGRPAQSLVCYFECIESKREPAAWIASLARMCQC